MESELLSFLTVINIALGILNTYWAYQRTCYNRDTLRGSERYWGSWGKRSKDVAKKVLPEISTDDLRTELEKRGLKKRKKKCQIQIEEPIQAKVENQK